MRKMSLVWTMLLAAFLTMGCEQDSVLEDAAEAANEAVDEMHDGMEEVRDNVEDAAEEIDNPQ